LKVGKLSSSRTSK